MARLEKEVLGSPRKAHQLLAAYRASSRMPNWKRRRYLDTVYLLRTYFLERDYTSMGAEEFVSFWNRCRDLVEVTFLWDYGRQFFRSWVLAKTLPIGVRTNIVNTAGRMKWFVLPESMRESVTARDEEVRLLIQQVREMNPSGAMIMLDMWGKAISAELIYTLIDFGRVDILEQMLRRNPGLIPAVVKPEELAMYLFCATDDVAAISRASQMLETKYPGVIRGRIGSILSGMEADRFA